MPLVAVAILRTSVVRRWLGLVVAVLAGGQSLLGPLFMAAMGVALLRRGRSAVELVPTAAWTFLSPAIA